MTKENKRKEFQKLYNNSVKIALNLPNKTPHRYLNKLLGTWSYEVIIDISFTNTVEKWKQLYNNHPDHQLIQEMITDIEQNIRFRRKRN